MIGDDGTRLGAAVMVVETVMVVATKLAPLDCDGQVCVAVAVTVPFWVIVTAGTVWVSVIALLVMPGAVWLTVTVEPGGQVEVPNWVIVTALWVIPGAVWVTV